MKNRFLRQLKLFVLVLSLTMAVHAAAFAGQQCATGMVSNTSGCAALPAGLTAWWPLDEPDQGIGGEFQDVVGGHDGIARFAPESITGKVKLAARFDGDLDEIVALDAPGLDLPAGTDFSIAFWIRTESPVTSVVLEKRASAAPAVLGYQVFLSQGRVGLQLATGVGSAICSSDPSTSACTNYLLDRLIADGEWHFVAVTVDRDQPVGGRWFLDGEEVGPGFNPTGRAGSLVNDADLHIGAGDPNAPSAAAPYEGDLDELMIARRVLTAEEIRSVYQAGDNGACSPPGPLDGTWTFATAGQPGSRTAHAMAYDRQRGVIVLFGGATVDDSYLADTWEWDGETWTKKSSTGPSGRNGHVMCYDNVREETLLFGGRNGVMLGDTWSWDGNEWRLLDDAGPTPRAHAALACDHHRGTAVLFGGAGTGLRGDTWEWDGRTWRQVATTGPTPRRDHAMTYDPVQGKVVLFGGEGGGLRNDTWLWDGHSWRQLETAEAPSPRSGHALAFDEVSSRALLFAGAGLDVLGDAWELRGENWHFVEDDGPDPRRGHAMVYAASLRASILVGGGPPDLPFSDTWALSLLPPDRPDIPLNPTEVTIPRVIDSGELANHSAEPKIVFSQDIEIAGASFARLYFSEIELEPGSFVRIQSLLDGEVQELDRFTAPMWGLTSAYLNGETIRLELVAAPDTAANRLVLAAVGAEGVTGQCSDGPRGTCSPDGRVPSSEDWSGRYGLGGCTASIYNPNGCFVSARHCWTVSSTSLSFRNPPSVNCDSQAPPVADQFPVINTAPSNLTPPADVDWRVGKIGFNSLGQTHAQRYGDTYMSLTNSTPRPGDELRAFGHGVSLDPMTHETQQLSVFTFEQLFGQGGLRYRGGSNTYGVSGSGIVADVTSGGPAIVGINARTSSGCDGSGTSVNLPVFVTARQQMCPHTVHVPWDSQLCLNETQATVTATVCNTSSSSDSFRLTFAGDPPRDGCGVAGPTSFQPQGGNIVGPIPAGDCRSVPVVIQRPPGLDAAKETACYSVTATSVSTGVDVVRQGALQDRRDLCTRTRFGVDSVNPLILNVSSRFEFSIENTSIASGLVDYRIEAFAPDMEPSGAISLDGGYFGEPSEGTLDIPLGTTATLAVDVTSRWIQPFDVVDLVVSSDTDGDGVYEALTSVGLRTVENRCDADMDGDGEPNSLCLSRDRFQVKARWRAPGGETGLARAFPATSDTGLFWFFGEDNLELVVKVLDACRGSDHFWVFAGGLTNVEVELEVIDLLTGQSKVYRNPQGTPFQPIQDTQAFATCEAEGSDTAGLGGPSPTDPATAVKAAELPLGEGRFVVEAEWQTVDGSSGRAEGVQLTSDTGYFWFFDEDNIELVVKVLDACHGFDRFWVFAAGLTNVQVRLTVTDTVTGESKVYDNPSEKKFEPIQDTDAFATCHS